MKLTPILDPAEEALSEVGLLPSKSAEREISKYLNQYGASVSDLASTVSHLSKSAQDDSIRLRATELGLKCHGILEKDSVKKETPQIVFIGADNSIINVLIPR